MRIGTAVTSGSAAATGGRAVQGLPGPRSAGTATVSSSRSDGTRMNRAVWYLAAVLPARVRHALPAGAAQPGQGWRSTVVAASPWTLSIRKVSHNCLAEPGGCARCYAKADLREPDRIGRFADVSQLVIYDTLDLIRGWVDLCRCFCCLLLGSGFMIVRVGVFGVPPDSWRGGEVDSQAGVERLGGQGQLVGGVDAEALDAGGEVGREHGQVLLGDGPALGDQLADRRHHVQGGVEDDRVGQQGGELEDLLLLLGVVVGDHPGVAEPAPGPQQQTAEAPT